MSFQPRQVCYHCIDLLQRAGHGSPPEFAAFTGLIVTPGGNSFATQGDGVRAAIELQRLPRRKIQRDLCCMISRNR